MMVIIFSERKNKTEKEIIEILTKHGGDYISDKKVYTKGGKFTVISEYKKTELDIENGIVIITDESKRFLNQQFGGEIIGICESQNKSALCIFEKNKIPIISCGNNPKNTITFSSLSDGKILLSLQRTISGLKFKETAPCELNIKLTKNYNSFSIMASAAVLLLEGIIPEVF